MERLNHENVLQFCWDYKVGMTHDKKKRMGMTPSHEASEDLGVSVHE